MKTYIIYDSLYGNTKKIAEAIGQNISGEVKIVPVKDVKQSALAQVNLLIVGSPTHAGRPTENIKKFLQNIPNDLIKDKYIAAFDTRASSSGQGWFVKMMINFLGFAAIHIQKKLLQKGGVAIIEPTGFMVKGKEGPLEDKELAKAKEWGRELNNQIINKTKP